jgi:hypothetical protein
MNILAPTRPKRMTQLYILQPVPPRRRDLVEWGWYWDCVRKCWCCPETGERKYTSAA